MPETPREAMAGEADHSAQEDPDLDFDEDPGSPGRGGGLRRLAVLAPKSSGDLQKKDSPGREQIVQSRKERGETENRRGAGPKGGPIDPESGKTGEVVEGKDSFLMGFAIIQEL